MPSSHGSTFTISANDLDAALLPEGSRTPGTDAFRSAVTDLIRSEYRRLGGRSQVVIDDAAGTIRVTWSPGAGQPDPLAVAVAKLAKGQPDEAIRILELLRFQRPDSLLVFHNLGMAMSDSGRLGPAVQYLTKALDLDPDHADSLVALGVALARLERFPEAIRTLRRAVELDGGNPWAHRNLGACLMTEGRAEEAERHLRRAVELSPGDQQARFGLGRALLALDRKPEADAEFIAAIDLDDRSPIAELAKGERRKLAGESFRSASDGAERLDAILYCSGALKRFAAMPRSEVQKVAVEIAILGQSGLDTNDAAEKYTLRSLPGSFSGLHLVATMYVAFKLLAPEHDVGFDLSREYEAALALQKKG
jgi:tetratricopeptide (TPR) repeat protein